MHNCPFNNSCIKTVCDMSCSSKSEFEHWMHRCDLKLTNPMVNASRTDINTAARVLDATQDAKIIRNSNAANIGVLSTKNPQYMADLVAYVAISKYCQGNGFYNGVYKLNFSKYLEDIKESWNSRTDPTKLEDKRNWIQASKFLVISNLGFVRFGDFESQTLLNIFQDRYDSDKFTIVVLEDSKHSLPGKSDSLFYKKLRDELDHRSVRL